MSLTSPLSSSSSSRPANLLADNDNNHAQQQQQQSHQHLNQHLQQNQPHQRNQQQPTVSKTCGLWEVTASYRAVIISSFVLLLVVMMTVQVVALYLITQNISDTLTSSCTQGLNTLSNASFQAIYVASRVAVATNLNAVNNKLTQSMIECEASVATTYNFLIQTPNASTSNVVDFLKSQMITSYYSDVNSIMIATSSSYLDVSLCDISLTDCSLDIYIYSCDCALCKIVQKNG